MRPRGNGLTREQQVEHINGELAALAFDIRQAHADNDLSALIELEVKRDHLLDWRLRLIPAQREGS